MSNLSVLAVENEPTIRCLLNDFLTARGHHCEVAACGVEALKMIPIIKPHVVVTGYSLSDMTGLELDSKIRRTYPRTKVIILSGDEESSSYTDIIQNNEFSFSQLFQQFIGIAHSLSEIDTKNGDIELDSQRNNLANTELAVNKSLLDILLKLRL